MFSHCDEGDRTTETCARNFKCWKYSSDGSAQARVIFVKGWLIENIKLSRPQKENMTINEFFWNIKWSC